MLRKKTSAAVANFSGAVTQTQASFALDLGRAVAALIVLLDHWHHLFFLDYGQLGRVARTASITALYVLTGAGHQAVVIFFVLSGYLISGSVFKSLKRGTWTWSAYLRNRLTRLWVVLIPALLLTAALDHFGMRSHFPYANAMYLGHGGSRIVPDVARHSGFLIGFGNLAFLQDIFVPTFGSNGALWSLANEFWYYILFPLGLVALRRGRLSTRILHFLLFVALAFPLRHGVLLRLPIWLFGTLLAALPAKAYSYKVSPWWLCAYAPIFFAVSRYTGPYFLAADLVLGVFTLLALWAVLCSGMMRTVTDGTFVRSIRLLARFSYTLYLVHIPLLVLAAAILLKDGRWRPDLRHTVEGVGVLGFVLVYAYAVAILTEFRTDDIRTAIERVRRPPVQQPESSLPL